MKRTDRIACCGREFSPNSYANHAKIHRRDELPILTCPHCPRTFQFEGALAQHLKLHAPFDGRFFAKIRMTSECWLWTGSLDSKGYAHFTVGFDDLYAHRVMYEQVVGPIPEGLELDHLCRTPHCVRPDHLEPVTHTVNTRRAFEAHAAAGCPCPHCDFVATAPGGLAAHIRFKHRDRTLVSVAPSNTSGGAE